MKSRGKSYLVGALVLALGLLAGCGPCWFCGKDFSARESGERRTFCQRWRHHRFGGKDFADHIMKRVDNQVKELDLSESQRQTYEEIRLKIKSNLTEAKEHRRHLFTELREEINQENPHMDRVTGLVKKHLRDMPSSIGENLDLFVEFYNALDQDQKDRVMKLIQERMPKD